MYDLDRVEELFHLIINMVDFLNILSGIAPEVFLSNERLYGDWLLNFVLSSQLITNLQVI